MLLIVSEIAVDFCSSNVNLMVVLRWFSGGVYRSESRVLVGFQRLWLFLPQGRKVDHRSMLEYLSKC